MLEIIARLQLTLVAHNLNQARRMLDRPEAGLPLTARHQKATTMATRPDCLRYWDLADHIQIDDAIALWCGVQPSELADLNFETQCISAKRAALSASLRDGRLEYIDLGIVTGSGKVVADAPVDELIQKGRLVIDKPSLRRWFEQLPFEDRPPFLFEEARQVVLPDGSRSAEMNSLKAIAVMAYLLAKASPQLEVGERPNSSKIGEAVLEAAEELLGSSSHLYSFHKKVAEALKVFGPEVRRYRAGVKS